MQIELEELDRETEDIVEKIGLPPCPAILTVLVRELRGDEPDVVKVGRLIGDDVTLAAAVLKTVNSPFYGLRGKISSIKNALVMLGLRTVTHLVTGLLLRQAFPAVARERLDEFWERSSGNARGCTFAARCLEDVDSDEAHTFGLFRDCGIPLLMAVAGKCRADRTPTPGGRAASGLATEQCRTTHAMIGGRLARSWHLPDAMSHAVLWHHEYPALRDGSAGLPAESVRLIALALAGEELYTRHSRSQSCPEWEAHGAFALEQLSLTDDEFEYMAGEAAAAFDAA